MSKLSLFWFSQTRTEKTGKYLCQNTLERLRIREYSSRCAVSESKKYRMSISYKSLTKQGQTITRTSVKGKSKGISYNVG